MTTTDLPRSLTSEEQNLVRWMLKHGHADAARYIDQLDGAIVVSRCTCGCPSIDFSINGVSPPSGAGLQILADFIFKHAGDVCGAFVFAKGELLTGLEIYGMAGDPPGILPKPDELEPVIWNRGQDE